MLIFVRIVSIAVVTLNIRAIAADIERASEFSDESHEIETPQNIKRLSIEEKTHLSPVVYRARLARASDGEEKFSVRDVGRREEDGDSESLGGETIITMPFRQPFREKRGRAGGGRGKVITSYRKRPSNRNRPKRFFLEKQTEGLGGERLSSRRVWTGSGISRLGSSRRKGPRDNRVGSLASIGDDMNKRVWSGSDLPLVHFLGAATKSKRRETGVKGGDARQESRDLFDGVLDDSSSVIEESREAKLLEAMDTEAK